MPVMAAPDFPRSDPAQPRFWDLRYSANFTPWDAGRVPVQLRGFIDRSRPAGRVLVPGCGSGHDVRFLAEAGVDVRGIDFSAAALAAARPVLGRWHERVQLADFFAPDPLAPYAVVYERAFLCALPRKLWADWAARLGAILEPGGLLAGYFYFDEGERGPPFPLADQAQLAALLGPDFECLEDAPATDSIDVFAGHERWQVWRRVQPPRRSTD